MTGRSRMSCTNCLFVSGSITLTAAVILVGISFFAPYWLSNLAASANEEREYTDPKNSVYLPGNATVADYPDRGLWAQCGEECRWFWQDDYMIQERLFTPLSQLHRTSLKTRIEGVVALLITTHTPVQRPFVWDYPGEPVPER